MVTIDAGAPRCNKVGLKEVLDRCLEKTGIGHRGGGIGIGELDRLENQMARLDLVSRKNSRHVVAFENG